MLQALPEELSRNLRVTRRHRIQYDRLAGFCCDDSKLYCVEQQQRQQWNATYWLTVYEIRDDMSTTRYGGLRLLDRISVEGLSENCQPRVDRISGRVYVPYEADGVGVFHFMNGHFMSAGFRVRCVKAAGVTVHGQDSVFASDIKSGTVCQVSVSEDIVIRHTPATFSCVYYIPKMRPLKEKYKLSKVMEQECTKVPRIPFHVSVLGETVLVNYDKNTLVMYHSDCPGQKLKASEKVLKVSSITTDGHSNFLVTDEEADSVFVLDREGKYRDKIQPNLGKHSWGLQDCAVFQAQLWLGYKDGSLVVMSFQ